MAASGWSVAIVITTYNHAHFLDEAIRSALGQTVAAGEIVVIDDGSTDDPAEVVRQYDSVRLIRTQNQGLSAARNTGLQAVAAEYVLFLDADDRLMPNALASGLRAFERDPGALLIYGAHRRIDREGRPTGHINYLPMIDEPFGGLLRGNRIGMHATVLYRRDAIVRAGGFDRTLPRCEDYDLYLRIAARGPIASHSDLVADYRIHSENMSADYKAMLTTALDVQRRHSANEPNVHAAIAIGQRAWRTWYGEQAMHGPGGNILRAFATSPIWTTERMLNSTRKHAARLFRRAAFSWSRHIRAKATPPLGAVDFGDFAGVMPVSNDFGWDRGRPIDRFYVEDFLGRNADAIRGRVLEIGDDSYSRQYGGERITRQDVLHVKPDAPGVTIVGDVTDPATLPEQAFDCIVFTQTLHIIFDMAAAIDRLHAALKPGGVLLITVPGITPVDRGEWAKEWFWSLTPAALDRLLAARFDDAHRDIETHGNVFAATAFLQGVACEEIDVRKLAPYDEAFPVTVVARATRAG